MFGDPWGPGQSAWLGPLLAPPMSLSGLSPLAGVYEGLRELPTI